MSETFETNFPSILKDYLLFQSVLKYSHHNKANHTPSQLELDHPGHPTRNDYCHNKVIDRLIDFEREDYQVTGLLGLEQESYQVNPLPPFQDSIDIPSQHLIDNANQETFLTPSMSQTMVYQKGLVNVQTSYYNVDNSRQGLTESAGEGITQKLSRSSSSESPKQMFLSSLSSENPSMCESPKQMSLSSFSSESPPICESPKQMSFSSFSSESPPMCESPKQMSLSSFSSFSSESSRQMSYSSEGTTFVYKSSKRMSWSEHKSRNSSSGRNTKRCSWSDETDMCLLLYLEQNKGKIEKLNNPHSGVKVEIWDGASEWMFTNGYTYTADQCYNRWKNNKRHYTNGILNEEKNPVQYKSVERILRHMSDICNMSLKAKNV